MGDTIPTMVVLSMVARGGRQELTLKLTLRLTHGCCIIAMEATLEDTMVDTIPTIVVLPLAVRGGRLPLSRLLTLRLTLGYCIMEDTMEDILDTMEAFMAIPTLLESKRMPQQMTKPDSFTNMFSKSSKISLFTY